MEGWQWWWKGDSGGGRVVMYRKNSVLWEERKYAENGCVGREKNGDCL